jgi:hypothetical protein
VQNKIAPPDMKNHFLLNAEKYDTLDKLKTEI